MHRYISCVMWNAPFWHGIKLYKVVFGCLTCLAENIGNENSSVRLQLAAGFSTKYSNLFDTDRIWSWGSENTACNRESHCNRLFRSANSGIFCHTKKLPHKHMCHMNMWGHAKLQLRSLVHFTCVMWNVPVHYFGTLGNRKRNSWKNTVKTFWNSFGCCKSSCFSCFW